MTSDAPPPSGDRWSPFPVQDWASMPPVGDHAGIPSGGRIEDDVPVDPYAENLWLDPARRTGPPLSTVDPGWSPPSSVPRWVPSLAIVLAFCLAAGGLWAVSRVSRGPVPASSRFLPADGASWYADVEPGSTGVSQHLTTVNESARLGLLEATQSVSFDFGAKLLGSLGSSDSSRFGGAQAWRVTSTETGPGAARDQRVRVYRVDRGVELMADSGPDGAEVYTPALRELPADPRPGDRWQSSGTTLRGQPYRADFGSAAGAGGCLQVSGRITLGESSAGAVVEVQRTWCPGQGLTRTSERIGGAATTEVIIDPSPPEPGVAAADLGAGAGSPVSWQRPTGWTSRTTAIHSADPQFGDAALPAQPGPVAPVVTSSGLLVRPVTQGSDLLVLSPPSALEDRWQVLRRLHPGGSITMLAGYGNLIVVGTSERRLIAYRPDGQRAWQRELNDLVTTAPARSKDAVAVVSASGDLEVIELTSGRVRWRNALRADVSAPTAADGSRVLVADRSGALRAFAAADGTELWQVRPADPVAAMIIGGDRLQVVNGSDLDARRLDDGTLLSRHPIPGTFRAVRTVGDLTVLTGTSVTEAVDTAGRLVWTRDGYDDLTTDQTTVIGWSRTGADVLDRTGRVVRHYPTEAVRGSENRQHLRYRQGMLMVSTVYNDIRIWS